MKENQQIVTADQDSITYLIPTEIDAQTPAEFVDRVITTYSTLVEAFEDVFSPTRVEFTPWKVPAGESPDQFRSRGECLTNEKKVITDQPVTGDQIRSALEEVSIPEDYSVFVDKIKITDTTAKLFLGQGTVSIDTDSKFYHLRQDSDIVDRRPEFPPWDATIYSDTEDGTGITISLNTHTRMYWVIYENRLKRINASKLTRAFESLRNRLDVSHIDPSWDDTITEEIVTGDVGGHPTIDLPHWPDTDAMIEAYRLEWVEEHLREQATASEIDGARLVDFGSVDETVLPEELKSRIETYLQQTDSHAEIDRVRVTTADDKPLEGTITGSSIKWDG